jgi:REP element-mobilizing transposase RayT
MRHPRYIVPSRFEYGIYRVISRTVDRQLVLGNQEKEKMISLMKRHAEFAGIKVLRFCMMENHFHWLVYLPSRPKDAEEMTDAELVKRLMPCQGSHAAWGLKQDLRCVLEKGWTDQHQKLRAKWLDRMWNLSAFVQSGKQRFYASLRSPSAIWLCYQYSAYAAGQSVWFSKKYQCHS